MGWGRFRFFRGIEMLKMAQLGHPDLAQYFEPVKVGVRCRVKACAYPALAGEELCRQHGLDSISTRSLGRSTAATMIDELGGVRRVGHGPPCERG